jgi:hypothetical protein
MQRDEHQGDRWFKEALQQTKTAETIKAMQAETRAQGTPLGETGRFTHGALTPDTRASSDTLSRPAAARSFLRSAQRLSGSG